MTRQVDHMGKVVAVSPQYTSVAIRSHGACSSCKAAALCGMGEAEDKLIEVPTDPRRRYAVGDEVKVVLSATMGLKAVWLGYFLPLLVLLAAALSLMAAGAGELVAGLAALALVVLYYLVLFLLRSRLRNEYVFTIQEQ